MLATGGLSGLMLAAMGLLYVWSLKALWRQNVSLHQQLSEVNQNWMRKFNELQEKRIKESQLVVQEVTKHTTAVDRTMEKVETTLDVLVELSRNGNRGIRR